MPTEMRRIVLTMAEFQDALKRFVESRPRMFHDARLMDCRLVRDDPVEVEVIVHPRQTNQTVYTLGGPHLAAALISYCQQQGIPLSRSAAKSVRRVRNGIALDMSIAPE